jgi:hypothetical protein
MYKEAVSYENNADCLGIKNHENSFRIISKVCTAQHRQSQETSTCLFGAHQMHNQVEYLHHRARLLPGYKTHVADQTRRCCTRGPTVAE